MDTPTPIVGRTLYGPCLIDFAVCPNCGKDGAFIHGLHASGLWGADFRVEQGCRFAHKDSHNFLDFIPCGTS